MKPTDWSRQLVLQLQRGWPTTPCCWWEIAATRSWSCSTLRQAQAMLLPVFGLSDYLHHLLRFGASPICTRCPKAARPAGTLSSQRSTLVPFVATAPLAEYLMDLRDSRLIGRTQHIMEILSSIAICYHTGLPSVPIGGVLIHDPLREISFPALLHTNAKVAVSQIIRGSS
jgi:hypothetical protein